jgi:hypothetical protein
MSRDPDLPRPPRGLKAPGRRLWNAVLTDFELRADELVVLAHAAHLQDQISILEAESRWTQSRLHRLAVSRLLGQLQLDDAVHNGQARSHLGRALARARWG